MALSLSLFLARKTGQEGKILEFSLIHVGTEPSVCGEEAHKERNQEWRGAGEGGRSAAFPQTSCLAFICHTHTVSGLHIVAVVLGREEQE